MDSRAPRMGQIEIPITLFTRDGQEMPCACLNISSTGALVRFLDETFAVRIGQQFVSKMLQRGQWVDVVMQVERIADDGIGMRFFPQA